MHNSTHSFVTSPAITVLMSVYNGAMYLHEAIDSILQQSFTNFEFIIIDDASTDASAQILRDYANQDSRITIYTNEANKKLAASLNKGLQLASASYIARMDADDVAHPERLERQFAFMQNNPAISVCGSALSLYESPNEHWIPPQTHETIYVKLFFESCLYHPTVIYKKDCILAVGGYAIATSGAEDYDLWLRLAEQSSTRFANIPDCLLRYRVHPDQRKPYKKAQRELAEAARIASFNRRGFALTETEFAAHLLLIYTTPQLQTEDALACAQWLDRLYLSVVSADVSYTSACMAECTYRWEQLFLRARVLTPRTAYAYFKGSFSTKTPRFFYALAKKILHSVVSAS